MALDRTKTLAGAEKLVKTGKLVEAIAEYKKLADDNPRDMNNFNKLGDLCVRAGKTQDAIRYFLRIAEFYASDGFFLKAIAMYKKISKLDPANMDSLQKLAALYLKQGLTIEAKAQYLEIADHFIKGSQFKKAVEVLAQVLEAEPDNIKVRMSYADLLARSGDAKEAAKQFAQVARELAAKGMMDEALKVGQKGLKVAPGNSDLMSLMLSFSKGAKKSPDELLASVVEMAKGNGDNPRSLALLGEAYLTAGKTREAEQVFRKLSGMGESAPPEVAAAVGRYHVSKDADGPALEWLGRAAEAFVQASGTSEAAGLMDEFLRAFPDHPGGLAKRADIASQSGDTKAQAAALLRLAQVQIGTSQPAQAAATLKTLIEIEPGNARYAEMLKSLEARGAGKAAAARPAAPAMASPEPEAVEMEIEPTAVGPGIGMVEEIEEIDEGPTELEEEDDAGEDVGPASLIQEMGDENEEDEPEDDEFVSEHFTEAEVFIKYGLLEKAKQQLLSILAKYPRHLASHTKLKEIYYEEGNKDKAVEECLTLADLLKAKGRGEESREMLNEAVRIDPNSPRVKQRSGSPAAPAAKPAPAKAPAAPAKPAPAPKASPAAAPKAPAPAAPKAAPARPAPPQAARRAAPAPVPELEIVEEEAGAASLEIEPEGAAQDDEISLEIEIPDEPAPPPRPAPSKPAAKPPAAAKPSAAAPARPVPEKIEEETPDDLAGGLSFGGDEITIEIDEGGGPTPAGMAATRAQGDPDPEKLGEVDFYIDQGLLEEARAVLFQLQRQFPESQEVMKRFERANKPAPPPQKSPAPAEEPVDLLSGLDLDVERAFGSQKSAPAATIEAPVPRGQKAKAVFKVETTPTEPEGDFFDLASELDKSLAEAQVAVDGHEQESLEGPGHSIDEIFKAFKKGVEQQVDSGDFETHYNLGIAYKEMGLVDEAIGEFQFAAKDPGRTVECCGILGLCFREKGMPELALKWYRKGLDSPDLGEHEAVGLRYDIAEIHRDQGDYAKALQAYTEVYGVDSNYRDVTAKIKEMKKLLG